MDIGCCNLSKLQIKGANLREGTFKTCDFTDADLTEAILEKSKLNRDIFKRFNLTNIKLGIFPEINVGSNFN